MNNKSLVGDNGQSFFINSVEYAIGDVVKLVDTKTNIFSYFQIKWAEGLFQIVLVFAK